MNAYDYALGLFSVLVGLALGDIASSVHKLVRHARTVTWDVRVVASSCLVTITIIRMWFEFWYIRDVGVVLHFPFYVTLFVELMILFLLASSTLPDDSCEGYDLGAFYDRNRRTLWVIFALFQTSYIAHWIYFSGSDAPLRNWLEIAIPLGCFVLLLMVRQRRLHTLLPIAVAGWYVYDFWNASLT